MKKNILPASVKANVEEAYDILLHDFKRQYLDSSTNLTVSKNTLLEMVPKAIANKNLLLLDDLLNFISDEARKKLDGQESYVINEFYNLNLPDKVKEKLNRIANVENLKFSTDLRAIYGAAASAVVLGIGIGSILVLKQNFYLKILLGIVSPISAYFTYKNVFDITNKNEALKNELELRKNLEESKTLTIEWLNEIADDYKLMFEKFCQTKGINY